MIKGFYLKKQILVNKMTTVTFTSLNGIIVNLLKNLGWWNPVNIDIKEEENEN
jgi:hypothetical protein